MHGLIQVLLWAADSEYRYRRHHSAHADARCLEAAHLPQPEDGSVRYLCPGVLVSHSGCGPLHSN